MRQKDRQHQILRTACSALLAAALLTPALSKVEASQPTAAVKSQPDPHAKHPVNHPGMPLESSIQLSREQINEVHQAAMKAVENKLKKYAKISFRQADKAAEHAVPGAKVRRTMLQTFGPNLVYIVLLESGSEKTLVLVDAGNGQVLHKRSLTPPPIPATPAPAPSNVHR